MSYFKHLRTVNKHRRYVRRNCFKLGLYKQGVLHDLSKYSPAEFITSARYFQGDRSPIDAEKEAKGYSLAWQNHHNKNKHHWEYWTDFDNKGNVTAAKMPFKHVLEMACDYIGAGMAYEGKDFTKCSPLNYVEARMHARHYHPDTLALLVLLLRMVAVHGVKEGLKKIRRQKRGIKKLYLT